MKTYLKSLYRRLIGPLATKADVDNLYTQLSSLLEVRDLIGRSVPLGPLRGWALSPDALLIVLRDIVARSAPRVVEFGSGESTIAIAAALKVRGAGRLVSIEHDSSFSKEIGNRLAHLGLADWAELRVVRLCRYNGRYGLPDFQSYDLTEESFGFDVALVDGPITPQFGAAARAVPLEWCLGRLERGQVIYLDDAARREEAALVAALKPAYPGITLDYIPTEKGLLKLTRSEL